MKLYNVRVRLGGSINNEVTKTQVTPAEIAVLQRMHGDDAVQNVVEVGSVNRSDSRERARLSQLYPKGPSADGNTRLDGPGFIASIFGVSGVPLPVEYVAPAPEPEVEIVEALPTEEETVHLLDKPQPIRRTRVTAPVERSEENDALDLLNAPAG